VTRVIDLTGQKFAKLTVISMLPRHKGPHTYWNCRCDCGGSTIASSNNLRRGRHASCGCGHKLSHLPEHQVWYNMLLRCGLLAGYPAAPNYANVLVWPSWHQSFVEFFQAVGSRPSPAHSLDRIDPNAGYWPGNVRWATALQQGRNKRTHAMVRLPDGRVMHTWEFGELLGVSTKQGWSIAKRRGWLQPARVKSSLAMEH